MRVVNNGLTRWLADRLAGWAVRYIERHPEASFVVERLDNTPYLRRWFVIPRNRWLNIYLHEYLDDDEDRALHDHPWWSASLCLVGELIEYFHHKKHLAVRTIGGGSLVIREAEFSHRLQVPIPGTVTLFVTGPRLRTWGFWCRKGWMDWRTFCARDGSGRARGCGEMA
jgi:hypothetical protein